MEINQLIYQFKDELFAFVVKKVKDTEAAKDLHQEILIRMFSNYHQLQNKQSLKPWLYRIANNAVIDHFRKTKKNFQADFLDAPTDQSDEELQVDDSLLRCMEPFVNQLREPYKEALLLTDLGDLSQKEYASAKGKSYSAAKSTIQRARAKLKETFIECCHIEADHYGNILSVRRKNNCSCS